MLIPRPEDFSDSSPGEQLSALQKAAQEPPPDHASPSNDTRRSYQTAAQLVKNPPADTADARDPWVRKIPGGKRQTPPVFLSEKSMNRGGWRATAHRSQTQTQLSTHRPALTVIPHCCDCSLPPPGAHALQEHEITSFTSVSPAPNWDPQRLNKYRMEESMSQRTQPCPGSRE